METCDYCLARRWRYEAVSCCNPPVRTNKSRLNVQTPRTELTLSATALADQLNLDFALINRKRRRDIHHTIPTVPPTPSGSESGSSPDTADEESAGVEKMELLVGDVRGRTAILLDDMMDTGHTVRLAAGVLMEAGAKEVYALVSHGLLSETTMENLKDLPVKKLVVGPHCSKVDEADEQVTNSIDQTDRIQACGGVLEQLDIAPIIAESIRRTHNGESISALFKAGYF